MPVMDWQIEPRVPAQLGGTGAAAEVREAGGCGSGLTTLYPGCRCAKPKAGVATPEQLLNDNDKECTSVPASKAD